MRHHAGRIETTVPGKNNIMSLLKTLTVAALLSTFAVASFAKPAHHHKHHRHHHHKAAHRH
jgi:hypothetical protein